MFIYQVVVVNFDPSFEKEGDRIYQIKKWPGSISQLTFPAGILSSEEQQLNCVKH